MLNYINTIISVGSVDGILTTAAAIRQLPEMPEVVFCQAFTVDRVDIRGWKQKRKILLIDLAVNNRDEKMTSDFVAKILEAGHEIVGICDEHDAEAWERVLNNNSLTIGDLSFKPISQASCDAIKSSGALMLYHFKKLPCSLDEETKLHIKELCEAADAGDRMDFTTHFGGLVNMAVKSKIADDSRRVYLAKHFAFNREPDEDILGWIKEYEEILKTHDEVIASSKIVGPGIIRVDTFNKIIDMTTLMGEIYKRVPVVVIDGESYSKEAGGKIRQISIGVKLGYPLDILATLKAAGVNASGFAQKVNLPPEEEEKALAAIETAIKNK